MNEIGRQRGLNIVLSNQIANTNKNAAAKWIWSFSYSKE
ncbi:hypothetical Protein pso3_04530 [Candidatus Phytoplasma solani]